MKYLGIDYGDKRIGLAIAGSDTRVALVYNTIKTENALYEIQKICREEFIDKIVVGLPLAMSGNETEQTNKTRKFIKLLKEKIELPIKEHDERLTSRIAEQSGVDKAHKDQSAAVLILQSYIDMIKL